jgi:hypothetical protein
MSDVSSDLDLLPRRPPNEKEVIAALAVLPKATRSLSRSIRQPKPVFWAVLILGLIVIGFLVWIGMSAQTLATCKLEAEADKKTEQESVKLLAIVQKAQQSLQGQQTPVHTNYR